MSKMTLQTEDDTEGQGEALAALEQIYAEQDSGEGPAARTFNAIDQEAEMAREQREQLMATSRVQLPNMAEIARRSFGDFPGVSEAVRQMTAPMSGISQLMLGEGALKGMGATLGITSGVSAWYDSQDSFRAAMGIADACKAVDVWKDAVENLRITSGVADSVSAMNAWRDELPSIRASQLVSERTLQPIRDLVRGYAAEQDAISKRIIEQFNLFSTAQKQREEVFNQRLIEVSKHIAGEQRQAREAMLAAFADVERWQGPSILWREAAPHHWQVYEPEPEPVQAPVQVTLESIELELRQGRLPLAALEELLQRYKCGMPEPIPPDIRFVALAYKEHGHRYDSQETFVTGYLQRKKDFPISVQTFKRWISQYESATGERIRPGRGSRKRRTM